MLMPMFWDRKPARLAAMLAVAGALAAPVAALAGIVVASSGPSAGEYPVGRKLEDAARISLKAGDAVTILDSRGTRVLRGPATLTVGSTGGPSRISVFNTLTRRASASRVRTGAVRGAESEIGKVINPSLWNLDASRAGTMCLLDRTQVQVWRPEWKSAAVYRIASGDGAAQATVTFKARETVGNWDVTMLPISDGAAFTIAGPGDAPARRVTFALLDQAPGSPEDLAAALIAKGCTAQLDLLSETLASPKN
ncbi:hypothetical protein [Novosphingobium album (ex Liu et al. 2023)]|uniref:Uncharacterized protein n=1 Tax=Novosphingobium album (ex Liu et al. 2023) TaxID=3031130 RepID=A0ABT5WNQ7_9SPHN|nr:hypothetical protein [Novosphingobium album (ex Liu et al. 2023)]MDE8651663.1 hypothetical protein [Novosphingobium album (ex Liu et al. 2023)]